MATFIVLGAQWGDEGKGKIVDMLSANMDLVVRFQGGANAGHTVKIGDVQYVLHLIPGGIVSGRSVNIIGNGCVVDPLIFIEEVDYLQEKGVAVTPDKLLISSQAHMVTPVHKFLDRVMNQKIGTTGRGIGPAYADKVHRTGIRMESILDGTALERLEEHLSNYKQISERIYQEPFPDIKQTLKDLAVAVERMRPFIADTPPVIKEYVRQGKNVLYEGAQGTLLDIDHGTYPFVTSSSTSIGGAYTGGGVYLQFDHRIAVVKAYTTRVGEGPFPTELKDQTGEWLREKGHEFGATTGRPRRTGWLDFHLLKRSFLINGFNYISLSKISCLSGLETIKVAVEYNAQGEPIYEELPGWQEEIEGITDWERLPINCRNYIGFIEEALQVPIGMVSTGPRRRDLIVRKELV